jgi:2-polyprenyl-3-methyl-5-hydroxy-6-metoxy-1,4-benzoquinol methylase
MTILATRSDAAELMDTDCRDYDDYRACLGDLARVNVVTQTHRPVLAWLRRATAGMDEFSLLDVACGHGDLLRAIGRWAARAGKRATLRGIDLNPWAIRAAREAGDGGIDYISSDVFAYAPATVPDLIVTSQFAHHLDDATLVRLLRWLEAHAGRGWYVADLRRHWLPYYAFPVLCRLAGWHRFVRYDGLVSITRSLTMAEWADRLRDAGLDQVASVHRRLPFRIAVERVR